MFRPLFIAFAVISYYTAAQSPVKVEWKQNFKTSLNSINKAVGIDFDKAGNVYVLGQTWLPDSSKDVMLIKYSPEGREIWRRIYDGPKKGDDIPVAIHVDLFENVWATGMSRISETNADFFLLKLSSDGIPADFIYDGAEHLFDCGTAITTDSLGFAYCGGYETTIDSGLNMIMFKVNPEMKVIWQKSYSTINMDVVSKISCDDSLNVFVAGNVNMSNHTADVLLAKYSSAGMLKWKYIFDGSMKENDFVSQLAIDDSENVYLSGYANHVNSRSDVFLLKFNQRGKLVVEKSEYGKIADHSVSSMVLTDQKILITGNGLDYNINESFSFLQIYSKGDQAILHVKSQPVNRFITASSILNTTLIVGTTSNEGLNQPFIASVDSLGKYRWVFTDDSFSGETHMVEAKIKGSQVYFLGDDAGEATGTITLMKYSLYLEPPEEKPKSPLGSKPHRYR